MMKYLTCRERGTKKTSESPIDFVINTQKNDTDFASLAGAIKTVILAIVI